MNIQFQDQKEKQSDMLLFKKISSLPLGPCSLTSSQGLASSSSTSLLQYICSTLEHSCCRPHQLRLMPLIFRIQQLPFVTGYKGSLLDQPCKRFLVCLKNLDFKIIRKVLVSRFSTMCVDKVLVKCRLCSDFLTFAVEF